MRPQAELGWVYHFVYPSYLMVLREFYSLPIVFIMYVTDYLIIQFYVRYFILWKVKFESHNKRDSKQNGLH